MIIQFNTDHNISGNNKLRASLESLIKDELNRYSPHLNRIDVHLSDEDGNKHGQNDIKCIIEARLEGIKHIAVTHQANTIEFAVEGAVDKFKNSLETIIGRLNNH